ncbi:tail fiber domain-containing protein [Rahnella aceris]|uniref:Tail fiber domain-containing protein n=1 Tax=Rahnella sp. (strain Y9602) TaxID=2703885 RepID=A0ABW6CFP0_RAHSY
MNPNGQGQSSGGWSATSDIDIKTNVVEIDPEEALEALAGWRTCSWDYRDTVSELNEDGKVTARVKGAKGFGYIAQDVQKNCPDAVTVTDNYTQHVADDGTAFLKKGVLSLNTLGVSAAYCGASIKALKKRNEDQAELIAVLLKRLEAVETNLGINGEPAS